jgi:hypothetical protein
MLNFLHFTRKSLNVKLIKIKLDLLINYKDSKLRLADRNQGMIAADILVFSVSYDFRSIDADNNRERNDRGVTFFDSLSSFCRGGPACPPTWSDYAGAPPHSGFHNTLTATWSRTNFNWSETRRN